MSSINVSYQTLRPEYITGLVDGEGSFSISFNPRPKLKVGWETRPSFSLTQNYRSRDILYKLQEFFTCGSIRFSKKDNCWKFEVRSIDELINKIIPHFKNYPLQTEKKHDFEKFEKIINLMIQQKHLEKEGLDEIFSLTNNMNISGKRKLSQLKMSDKVIV